MGRSKRIILLIVLLFAGLGLFFYPDKESGRLSIKVKKNQIIIDNFKMAKVIDEENNYYRIKAVKAYIDNKEKTADLTDFNLEYAKGDTKLIAKSDRGVLKEEVYVDVKGRIEGTFNTLAFHTDENGTFKYDFETEIGVMTGNVVVISGEGTILSDKAIIYHKENKVEFDGKVKVYFNK